MVQRQIQAGSFSYTYDSKNQLTGVQYPDDLHQQFAFDSVGNRLNLTETQGDAEEIITSEYNVLNQLLRSENSLLSSGDLISLYGRFEEEDIEKIVIDDRQVELAADNTFRLEDLKLNPGNNTTTIQAFDRAGNSSEMTLDLFLDETASITCTYDLCGNMITRSSAGLTWRYVWDAEGHLIKAHSSEGKTIEYVYYGDNRNRLASRVDENTKVTYIYDNDHCIAAYDNNGNLMYEYFYGPMIDNILCRIDADGNADYYHQDAIHSVIAVSDNTGAKTVSYEYDVYGNIIDQEGIADNDILYTGRWQDADTGLYNYRARWYDAESGRFLSRDPIGFVNRDWNLYRYVRNNPVIYFDPYGYRECNGTWVQVGEPYGSTQFHNLLCTTPLHFDPTLEPGTTPARFKESFKPSANKTGKNYRDNAKVAEVYINKAVKDIFDLDNPNMEYIRAVFKLTVTRHKKEIIDFECNSCCRDYHRYTYELEIEYFSATGSPVRYNDVTQTTKIYLYGRCAD